MIENIFFISFAFFLFFFIFFNWKKGIYFYILYTPFYGAVALLFYPTILPLLVKDLLFLFPSYLSFILNIFIKKDGYVPKILFFLFLPLFIIVLIQSFNPNVDNFLVSLIGFKVWLFYIPIAFLSYQIINSEKDILRLCRFIIFLSWFPCLIGIIQYIGIVNYGYEEFMTFFYGYDAALAATQKFTKFTGDVGEYYRIPSTFTYVGQYFGYLLSILPALYIVISKDYSNKWRLFAKILFLIVCISAFLGGNRAAFIFIPLFIFFLAFFQFNLLKACLYGVLVFFGITLFFSLIGILPFSIFGMVYDLVIHYLDEIIIESVKNALIQYPMGSGTGMNTGASRFAYIDTEPFGGRILFESYYAKSIAELGIPGLLVMIIIFWFPIFYFYKNKFFFKGSSMEIIIITLMSFLTLIAVNSFKGWQLDMDPMNFYYWLYYGIFLKSIHLATKLKN